MTAELGPAMLLVGARVLPVALVVPFLGGPLVPIDNPALFDNKVKELDDAIDLLDRMKSKLRRFPIANPAPGHSISSSFGVTNLSHW